MCFLCRCQKGRCPLCFPTVLHLDDSREVQLKIWDMAFYCETCSKKEVDPKTNKKKLPKLHENLQSAFEGGKAAGEEVSTACCAINAGWLPSGC